MIARCSNIFDGKHKGREYIPAIEPSPCGGWRATCKCGAQWLMTPAEVRAAGLESEGKR